MKNFTFLMRRGLSAEWTTKNPILRSGEFGIELDTLKFKLGDAVQNWNDLPYFVDQDVITAMIAAAVIEGVPGPPGDSAYQVALDNGFVGTEEEWLDSLIGPPGADGADGEDGAPGTPGTNGTNGTDGQDGASGVDGEDGAPGSPGADGDSAYEVAVDNGFVGTEAEWLDSLVGPAGADGEDGSPGTPGTPGADGDDGTPGSPGADGDSAYQIALDNDFVGTESEWLDSLVGPQGPTGATGAQGPQGIQGATGATGSTGSTGATGATGAAGADGVAGGVTPISGKYSNAPVGMVGSNLTLTSGTEFAVPMAVAENGTILGFGFELVTVGAAGAVVRGGIRIGNNAKRPGTASLLQEAPSTIATDSGTGAKEFTFTTPQAVSKGDVIWFTLTGQTASCIVRAVGSSNPYVYDTAVATGTQTASALIQTGVSGALGANYTPSGSNNGPRVSVKWQ